MTYDRILSTSPMARKETRFIIDPDGTQRVVETQMVGNILEANIADQNNPKKDLGRGKWRHVARIPNGLYQLWSSILGDPKDSPDIAKAWTRRLNDPEFQYLRVDNTRL